MKTSTLNRMGRTSRNCAIVLILHLAMTTTACSEQTFSTAADFQSVVTIRMDEDRYDFSGITVYDMPNRVFDLAPTGSTPLYVEHVHDDLILNAVRAHMEDRGFIHVSQLPSLDTESESESEPDLYLTVALVAEHHWTYTGEYPFRAFRVRDPEDDDPGYPTVYYPKPPLPLSYSADSIILTLVDRSERYDDNAFIFEPVWTAGIHAALIHLHNTTATQEAIENGIAAAFAQSPYLIATEGGSR